MGSTSTDRWVPASYARPMERAETDPTACAEADCAEAAAVRLHVPWDENRAVCPAHARVLAQQDGVVAEPLDDGNDWP